MINIVHDSWLIYNLSHKSLRYVIVSLILESLFLTTEQATTFLLVPHILPKSTLLLIKTYGTF